MISNCCYLNTFMKVVVKSRAVRNQCEALIFNCTSNSQFDAKI